jgi:hypothetical protein
MGIEEFILDRERRVGMKKAWNLVKKTLLIKKT